MWIEQHLEWKSLIEAVGRYRDPGRFTPLLGYEWTAFPQLGGHHNVYSPTTKRRSVALPVAGCARARGAVERTAARERGRRPAGHSARSPGRRLAAQ